MFRRQVRSRAGGVAFVLVSASLAGSAMFASSAVADPGNSEADSHEQSGTAATVGPTTSPQPNSNADDNGHGANVGPGPYTSTRNGSASGNGSGNGLAIGEPCAGCVGKADNKNPPGQMPDSSDPNSGYECDLNHGVAQTNPAHTGCDLSVSTPVVSSPPVVSRPPGASSPPEALSSPEVSAGEAVSGEQVSPGWAAGVVTRSPAAGSLAFTGTDLLPLVVTGLGALGLGAAAMVFGRRLDGA
jgi:hypothetical protein